MENVLKEYSFISFEIQYFLNLDRKAMLQCFDILNKLLGMLNI